MKLICPDCGKPLGNSKRSQYYAKKKQNRCWSCAAKHGWIARKNKQKTIDFPQSTRGTP